MFLKLPSSIKLEFGVACALVSFRVRAQIATATITVAVVAFPILLRSWIVSPHVLSLRWEDCLFQDFNRRSRHLASALLFRSTCGAESVLAHSFERVHVDI